MNEETLVCQNEACRQALDPNALECPACHALVHAAELELLAQKAATAAPGVAVVLYEKMLPLLPAEARQAVWARDRIATIHVRLNEETERQAEKERQSNWARRFGPFAPLLLLLAKAKSLLFVLFKMKFLTGFLWSLWLYAMMWGWRFGLGILAGILVHELGHYIDIRRRGLPAEIPVFLPGLGAYVQWDALGVGQRARAEISLAGPLAGGLFALGCMGAWQAGWGPIWAGLAHTTAMINVLNLIPVWTLDGAQAGHAIGRQGRWLLLAAALLAWAVSGQGICFFLAAGMVWLLVQKNKPTQEDWHVTGYFVAVMAGLAWLMAVAPNVQPR